MLGFKNRIKLVLFKLKWGKKHPESIPMNLFSPDKVVIGNRSYGELNILSFNNMSTLRIGNYVSIAQHVTFLLDVEHQIRTISTYPFKKKTLQLGNEAVSKGDIIVDDDVWIGYGATILSGVHIGQGAVIAAGAVVTKDVSPYAIVGGAPAKVLKYRFKQEVVDFLLTLDYSGLTEIMICEHVDELYFALDDINIDEIKKIYDWFPKKGQYNENNA